MKMMSNDELNKICSKIASNLSGVLTGVKFIHPARKDSIATAGRRHGRAFIEITPGLPSKEFLYCLAHEIAHIKQLWDFWKYDLPEYPPNTIEVSQEAKKTPIITNIEDSADILAKTWLKFADDHAAEFEGNWLECRLKVLASMDEMKTKEMIDRAVERGVSKALKKFKINKGDKNVRL